MFQNLSQMSTILNIFSELRYYYRMSIQFHIQNPRHSTILWGFHWTLLHIKRSVVFCGSLMLHLATREFNTTSIPIKDNSHQLPASFKGSIIHFRVFVHRINSVYFEIIQSIQSPRISSHSYPRKWISIQSMAIFWYFIYNNIITITFLFSFDFIRTLIINIQLY